MSHSLSVPTKRAISVVATMLVIATALSGCFIGPRSAITDETAAYPFERLVIGGARGYGQDGGPVTLGEEGYSISPYMPPFRLRDLGDDIYLMQMAYEIGELPVHADLAGYAVLQLDREANVARIFRLNRTNERDAAFGIVACAEGVAPEIDPLAGHYEFACGPDEESLIAAARAAVANRTPFDPELYVLAQDPDAPDVAFAILAIDTIRAGIETRDIPAGRTDLPGFAADLIDLVAERIGFPATIEGQLLASVGVAGNRFDLAIVPADDTPPGGLGTADPLAVGPVYIVTREEDPIRAMIEEAVAALTEDGTIGRLEAFWFPAGRE